MILLGCAASQLRCDSSTTKAVRVIICCIRLLTYMMNGTGYFAGGCLGQVLTFHSLIWVLLDLGSAACTSFIYWLGCAGSQLRCDSSTTKGARVAICCIRLLTYMMNGTGYFAGGCLGQVLTFHSLIWVLLLAHHLRIGWAVQQAS
jgi:hypothetical protein